MKKTMSSESLIRPEGKTGCIFEMSDDVQARARTHTCTIERQKVLSVQDISSIH